MGLLLHFATRLRDVLVPLVAALWALLRPKGFVVEQLRDVVRTREELRAENALLRQQLIVLRRKVRRVGLEPHERLVLMVLASLTRTWRSAVLLVKPETVLRWHRKGWRLLWRHKSKPPLRPTVDPEVVTLIERIATDNRSWGAERIRGELLKLGWPVAKRTVQKYMRRVRPPERRRPSQSWSTFIRNHASETWACDFIQTFDLWFRPIFAFVVVHIGTRAVVHVNATYHPTERWTTQQLREATAFGDGPRFLVRDNDAKYGETFDALARASGIAVKRTPRRAPMANAFCERFIGSVRRECLDHVLVLGVGHLRRVLREYVGYFNWSRPHQGLDQRVPWGRDRGRGGRRPRFVRSIPVLGGLHHVYEGVG